MKLHVRFQTFGFMNRDIIRTEIRDLVEVIREQQEIILAHTGNIPQIELDILMGNVRKLYERLWELQTKVNSRQSAVDSQGGQGSQVGQAVAAAATVTAASSGRSVSAPVPVSEPAPAERSVSVPVPVSEQALRSVSVSVPFSEPVPVPVTESNIQPEELLASIETPVQAPVAEIKNEAVLPQANLSQERAKEFAKPSAKATPLATLFDEPETLADKFPGQASLYDKISATKEDKSLASKLQKNPVSDLKKSIGINEKFSFINELFDGNLNAYNEAIDKLNASAGYTEAIAFLDGELLPAHQWDQEGQSYLNLKNLVERRFGA